MPLAGRYHGLGFRNQGVDHIVGGDFPYAVDLIVEEVPSVVLVPAGTLVVVRDILSGMAGVQVPSRPATFEIRRNDRLPVYQVDAYDADENPLDLSAAIDVLFSMRDRGSGVIKVNGVAGSVVVGVDGSTHNRMRYDWQDGDTDTSGEYECEFELTFSPGVKRTFPASEKQALIVFVHDDIDAA